MSYDDLVRHSDRMVQSVLGGEVVTYASSVGSPIPVTGMFDSNYVLAKGDSLSGVEATVPAVSFRLEDLPIDPELEPDGFPTLTIRGESYRVIERRPDGMGLVVLVVRRIT